MSILSVTDSMSDTNEKLFNSTFLKLNSLKNHGIGLILNNNSGASKICDESLFDILRLVILVVVSKCPDIESKCTSHSSCDSR